MKCIVVGTDNKSGSLLFYHPPSKQLLVGSIRYHLDTYLPSGPQFHAEYDGLFNFNTKGDMDGIHQLMTHEENSIVNIKQKNEYMQYQVITCPLDDKIELYMIQETESSQEVHEVEGEKIIDHHVTQCSSLRIRTLVTMLTFPPLAMDTTT